MSGPTQSSLDDCGCSEGRTRRGGHVEDGGIMYEIRRLVCIESRGDADDWRCGCVL